MENRSLLDRVVTATSNVFDVEPEDVRGRCRGCIVSDARQMAMYIAREKGEYITRIAQYFGISRQAVSFATKRVDGRIKSHRPVKERHDRIAFIFANLGK